MSAAATLQVLAGDASESGSRRRLFAVGRMGPRLVRDGDLQEMSDTELALRHRELPLVVFRARIRGERPEARRAAARLRDVENELLRRMRRAG